MRSELFHPLISHFPIVLFTLFPVVLTASFFVKESYRTHLAFCARLFLYIGMLGQFLSMYLGDLALEKINTTLCRLQLAYDHEHNGRMILYIFIVVVAIDAAILSKKYSFNKALNYGKLLVSLVGLWFVIQTGHTGSQLVYDYGAAVQVPQSCRK